MQKMLLLPQSELEREFKRQEAQRKERAQNIACIIILGTMAAVYGVMMALAI